MDIRHILSEGAELHITNHRKLNHVPLHFFKKAVGFVVLLFFLDTVEPRYLELAYFELPLTSK